MNRLSEELTEKTIDEVCSENNISLKELFDKCIKSNPVPRPRKKKKQKYHSTGEMYIHCMNEVYYVRKWINGKTEIFGAYPTLQEAILLRDYLVENGWHKPYGKTLQKIFGGEHGRNKRQ